MNTTHSTLHRYRSLIISIVLFLILIASLLTLNFFASLQAERNSNEIGISGYMRELTETIKQDLFDLKLSYGEDPLSPHMNNVIKRLDKNLNTFTQNLSAFINGGTASNINGKPIQISAVADPHQYRELLEAQKTWNIWRPLMEAYLEKAQTFELSLSELNLAVNQAQSSSIQLNNTMNHLANDIQAEADKRANQLKILQISGIVIIIFYLFIFLFFFIRRLMQGDREAAEARKDTNDILRTVNEGLFLLDKELNIGHQYSQNLEKIIGVKQVAGKSLHNLFQQIMTERQLETTNRFIGQLFNDAVVEDLIHDLNPLNEVEIFVKNDNSDQAKRKYLRFNFSRIYAQDEIERVLVSTSDITKEIELARRLEREREESESQMDILMRILYQDKNTVNNFIINSRQCLNTVNAVLKSPESGKNSLQQKNERIFREIHSLKGEASALGLTTLVQQAQNIESDLRELRQKHNITGNDFLPMTVKLQTLFTMLDRIEGLNDKVGAISAEDINTIEETPINTVDNLTQILNDLAKNVSKRNSKEVIFHHDAFNAELIPAHSEQKIKEILIQLIRNAVVHGIESPKERQAKSKHQSGNITLSSKQENNRIVLKLRDDGQGIDYEKLRTLYAQQHHMNTDEAAKIPQKTLLQFMFKSGTSTMSNANQDAGQGVGLDILVDRLRQIGGKLNINSERDQYTEFTLSIPTK